MDKIRLSSPWVNYAREIHALFKDDPDIMINFDDDDMTLKLYVKGQEKADALTQLLPMEKSFGNVTLKISVVPANLLKENKASLFQKAFEGNPAFAFVKVADSAFSLPMTFVVFRKRVVQYFDDDLGDLNGIRSTLYQDIAKEIFEGSDGVYFCTDTEDLVGSPLGEWP